MWFAFGVWYGRAMEVCGLCGASEDGQTDRKDQVGHTGPWVVVLAALTSPMAPVGKCLRGSLDTPGLWCPFS